MPISLRSVDDDMNRFRANIMLKGGKAFDEDLWEEIAIASDSDQLAATPIISVVSKCPRCLVCLNSTSSALPANLGLSYRMSPQIQEFVIMQSHSR